MIWREIIIMSEDHFEQQHQKLLDELVKTNQKEKKEGEDAPGEDEEDEDVECVDTKIRIWDTDQNYKEYDSDYLNQIFPYKLNKKTIAENCKFIFHFLSSSLHYWIEMTQEGQPDPQKLNKKDVNVISEIIKTEQCDNSIAYHRWGENFNKKEEFMKRKEEEAEYQHPEGQVLHQYSRDGEDFEIVKYQGNNKQFCEFKQRMEVLLLFYIDGVSFIFEEYDTWIYYIIYKRVKNSHRKIFVGMLSKYIFRLSTLNQVFIQPNYQKSGHGKELIDKVYQTSLQDQKCFEITTEIPSFEYQCLRDFKELEMIVQSGVFEIEKMKAIKDKKGIDENRSELLKRQNVRKIKETLKIPGHQIQRLVNIIIFYQITKQNDEMAKAHFTEDLKNKIIINRSPFKTRRKLPHLTLYGTVPNLKDFMVQKAKQDLLRNQEEVLELLLQTMNGFDRVVAKALKSKLLK